MISELRDFLSGPAIEWAPRLTVVFLIGLRPWRQHEAPQSLAFLLGIAYLAFLMAGLLIGSLPLSPVYWFILVGIHFLWIINAYPVADNHRYLEGYWCLSIAIALTVGGSDVSRFLALDARFLIGLCFFFAALWKILAPGYRDGSFFVYTLLFEQRFLPVALWLGRITPGIQMQHQMARSKLATGRSNSEQASVPARLRRTGLFLAWWTIAIEALLAALFLLPFPGLELWRVAGLGLFVITTYLLVPVPTFGYILLLMLLVTTEEVQLRMYILALAAALLFMPGIAELLRAMANRRMKELWRKASIPRFFWTPKALLRRLEQDGESSWRLVFPSIGVSIYAKAQWFDSLQNLLEIENPLTWEELVDIAPAIPAVDLKDLVATLRGMKLLNYSKPN